MLKVLQSAILNAKNIDGKYKLFKLKVNIHIVQNKWVFFSALDDIKKN
jgi:hypothetical protein